VNLFLSEDDGIHFFAGRIHPRGSPGYVKMRNDDGWYDLSADRMTNKLHSPMFFWKVSTRIKIRSPIHCSLRYFPERKPRKGHLFILFCTSNLFPWLSTRRRN